MTVVKTWHQAALDSPEQSTSLHPPSAITAGATEAEALDHAQDALVVAVPPRVAIKRAIHEAMREQAMTLAQLGERLGIDGRQVRRILDLDHESKLSQRTF